RRRRLDPRRHADAPGGDADGGDRRGALPRRRSLRVAVALLSGASTRRRTGAEASKRGRCPVSRVPRTREAPRALTRGATWVTPAAHVAPPGLGPERPRWRLRGPDRVVGAGGLPRGGPGPGGRRSPPRRAADPR